MKFISNTIFKLLLLIIPISLFVACGGSGGGTPNDAPTTSDVSITDDNAGDILVGDSLTGAYTYTDTESDPEGTSTYRWLRNGTPISGATSDTYTLTIPDGGQNISFEITPIATAGTLTGAAVISGDMIVLTSFSATYCDGPTVDGNCTLSIVEVPDFVDVLCVDSDENDICPSATELYFGQDGNFSINPESYNFDGTTVVESTSGLTWAPSAYPADTFTAAIAECGTLASTSYAGINDWRVPTMHELSRIISKKYNVWPADMENPANSFWWTLTQDKNNPDMALGMSGNWPWTYSEPTDGTGMFSGAQLTFCVSGPTMAGAWGVYGTAVVHTVTGLMWQRTPSSTQFDWDTGLQYCENSTVGGFDDWRLPTLREYISVLDFGDGTEYMSAAFEGILDMKMLTSTPNAVSLTSTLVAYINESTGISNQENIYTLEGGARCVRGPIN